MSSEPASSLCFVPRKKRQVHRARPPPSKIATLAASASVVTQPSVASPPRPTPPKEGSPPPLHLSPAELECDHALARASMRHVRANAVPFAQRLQQAYDPAAPNDFAVFKAYVKQYRQDRARGFVALAAPSHTENKEAGPSVPQGPPPPGPPPRPPALASLAPRTRTPNSPHEHTAAATRSLALNSTDILSNPPGLPPRPPHALYTHHTGKQRAAAAMAATFTQRRVSPEPELRTRPLGAEPATSDPSTFAERLMAMYGYRQGEGLVRLLVASTDIRVPRATRALWSHCKPYAARVARPRRLVAKSVISMRMSNAKPPHGTASLAKLSRLPQTAASGTTHCTGPFVRMDPFTC